MTGGFKINPSTIREQTMTVADELETIAAELRELIPRAELSGGDYLTIGRHFLRVKSLLTHGQWLPWLRRNGFKPRQSQNYMAAAAGLAASPHIQARLKADPSVTLQTLLVLVRHGKKALKKQRRREDNAALTQPAETLINGDSLKWMRRQPDNSFRHIVTDPPYGIGMTYEGWTEPDTAEDHWRWLKPFWEQMQRLTKPGGSVIMYQSPRYLSKFSEWFGSNITIVADCFTGNRGKCWQPIIVWAKPGRKPFQCILGNVWLMGGSQETTHPGHPCSKPVAAVKRVIRELTDQTGPILDPFAGIGTIPLACLEMGIHAVGVERQRTYHQIGAHRVNNSDEAFAPV